MIDGARRAVRDESYFEGSAINAAVGVALLRLAAVFVVEAIRGVCRPAAA